MDNKGRKNPHTIDGNRGKWKCVTKSFQNCKGDCVEVSYTVPEDFKQVFPIVKEIDFTVNTLPERGEIETLYVKKGKTYITTKTWLSANQILKFSRTKYWIKRVLSWEGEFLKYHIIRWDKGELLDIDRIIINRIRKFKVL